MKQSRFTEVQIVKILSEQNQHQNGRKKKTIHQQYERRGGLLGDTGGIKGEAPDEIDAECRQKRFGMSAQIHKTALVLN